MLSFSPKQKDSDDIFYRSEELIPFELRESLLVVSSKINSNNLHEFRASIGRFFEALNFSTSGDGREFIPIQPRNDPLTFALGPATRNSIFERSGELLEQTNKKIALITVMFGSKMQLGVFQGDYLPYTSVWPVGLFICGKTQANKGALAVSTEEQAETCFSLVFVEQVNQGKTSSSRALILSGLRGLKSFKTKKGGEQKMIDSFRLIFVEGDNYFEVSKEVEASDREYVIFPFDGLNDEQSAICRDWLAFLKRGVDSLPYQLEKRSKVLVLDKGAQKFL